MKVKKDDILIPNVQGAELVAVHSVLGIADKQHPKSALAVPQSNAPHLPLQSLEQHLFVALGCCNPPKSKHSPTNRKNVFNER